MTPAPVNGAPGAATATDLPDDDVRLLGEIAVSAAMNGYTSSAEPIFAALSALRPEQALGDVGLALCALSRGDAAGALQRLQDCIASRKRGKAQAQGIMLFVMEACGRKDDAERQARAMSAAAEPAARQAARVFLMRGQPRPQNQGLEREEP